MGAFLEYVLDAIFIVAMLRMIYSALRHFFAPPSRHSGPQVRTAGSAAASSSGEMARDPECGMFVSTELSHRLRQHGEVLHFCSEECLEKFQSRAQAS